MSNCYSAFSLPFLHKELAETGSNPVFSPEIIKHIWPGLPHMPADFYWSSPDYKLDVITAEHCIKSLDAMGEAAMTGVPMQSLALMDIDPKVRDKRQELNDLKAFAQNGIIPPSKKDVNDIYVAAQNILLWAWLLEEKILEMRNLMNKYKESSTSTIDPLFVEEESSMNTLLNVEYALEDGTEPLPSWKLVLENAALFLPDKSVVFVSCSQMMSDLLEILDFQKGKDDILKICTANIMDNYHIIQSESFVWKALGMKNTDNKHFGLDKSLTFVILRSLNESIPC